ncbi:hypothetical protein EON81_13335 [bacterium]|nr:MAG: hypothetical protein EON81_13335 [bacterium]
MKSIHRLVDKGEIDRLREWIETDPFPHVLVNEVDEYGWTPLYYAVTAAQPNPDMVDLLLKAGADLGYVRVELFSDSAEDIGEKQAETADDESSEYRESLLSVAIRAGNLQILRLLHDYGADFHYHDEDNYTALLDAVLQGVNMPVLRYLIGLGLDLNAETSWNESPVSVAYCHDRFEALVELLKAGAEEIPLKWTPLHRAVSIGTIADVQRESKDADSLHQYDIWGRTPIHIALLRGNAEMVEVLQRSGGDVGQRAERGTASLSFAAKGDHLGLLEKVLATGCSSEDKNAALSVAVEENHHGIAHALLIVGAAPTPAMGAGHVWDRQMILLLHQHGADLSKLDTEGRRHLLGLVDGSKHILDGVSRETYLAFRYVFEGTANPQDINDPFRLAMVRSGSEAFYAQKHFEDPIDYGKINHLRSPVVWCFDRFGQSTTILPDGRIILIGGEHEDFYHPTFCIYNDVSVFDPDGTITILGYPFSVFPPTDFHTATLVDSSIYIIGSLGYPGSRGGPIPVYRLSCADLRIERVETSGEQPGRIFKHAAKITADGNIQIEGGKSISFEGPRETTVLNTGRFILNLQTLAWSQM